jgi:hypothetical protein
MSLANYSDLQTSVATWLHRTDLTSIIPDLITIAEMRLNADLAARDMETTATLSTVANTKTLALPTDVTESRRLVLTSQDPKRVLNYIAPEKLTENYPYSTTGIPEVYTVIGGNLEFGPTPDAVYTLEYVYRQRLPSLVTNSTNWLMTKWPHVYLYATLCAAAPYLGQDQRIQVWEDAYQKAVHDINSVDWYSGSTMAVRFT